MATDLRELRAQARRAGVKGFKSMTREELEEALSNNGSASRPRKKAAVKKAARRGSSTSAPAKKKNRAKRRNSDESTARPTRKPTRKASRGRASTSSGGNGGRNIIGKINWKRREGWNPVKGGAVEQIFNLLVKHNGDTEKVFRALVKDVADFVPRKKQNGERRTKGEMESFLRYRINRVRFDFAVQTGQHEPSPNRAKYGTGGTGTGVFKRGTSTKAATRKRGRPKAETPRKRGRPVGSKNRRTAGATAGSRKARGRKKSRR